LQRKKDPQFSGPIYWRSNFSDGGKLILVFAHLQQGVLRLYKTEEVCIDTQLLAFCTIY
jgi:hypothetical protein